MTPGRGTQDLQAKCDGHSPASVPFCDRNQFQAVVFDCDGVVVDSRENYLRAYEMVLSEAGVKVTPREIYLREGQPTPQLLSALLNLRRISVTETQIREMVERRRVYDAAVGPREFFPTIRDLFLTLRASGRKLGMVTGSSRRSVNLVLTPERSRWFDVVITADDVERSKPDPQPFILAAEGLAVDPKHCLVIENAPFGIKAAHLAGCRTIGICTTLEPEDLQEADWIVRNHDELARLLAARVDDHSPMQTWKAW